MSSRKRSNAELADGSSVRSKKDDQSCNPSKEGEKRQSDSTRKESISVGPLESDEEPKNTTPSSSFSRKGGASSNPLASEKKDERSPTISNSDGDGGLGRSPEHDVGREDAPCGNGISIQDFESNKTTSDEGNNASAPTISNTAGDAPKSFWQHGITSSGGSDSGNIGPPVIKSTRRDRGTT